MNIKLTEEQIRIIEQGQTGETFVVDATAGSGKTFTAQRMIQAMGTDVLYLVFNRSAADDARKAMKHLSNVKVSTTSALAWHEYKRDYGERMDYKKAPRVKAEDTAKLAEINEPLDLGDGLVLAPITIASMAMETIEHFCRSADKKITGKHVRISEGFTDFQAIAAREEIAKWAWKIWCQSLMPGSKHRFTMAYGLKMLAMSRHKFGHDAVVLDEAQDSNNCVEKLVKNQQCQAVCIGDPAQAINGWNGGRDIMDNFEGPRLTLSRSFRFGEDIAEEARKHLAHTGTGITLTGNPDIPSQVSEGGLLRPKAVLCRTNAAALGEAIRYLDQNLQVAMSTNLIGRLQNLAFAAGDLMAGRPVENPELAGFANWKELVAYTNEPGGADLKVLVQLIGSYGVGGIKSACKKMVKEEYGKFDIAVSTAHTAKGREWDTVRIHDDFREPKQFENPITGEMEPGVIDRDEAMLHYVAVTRARKHLDREGLKWIDDYAAVEKEKV